MPTSESPNDKGWLVIESIILVWVLIVKQAIIVLLKCYAVRECSNLRLEYFRYINFVETVENRKQCVKISELMLKQCAILF